jgi:hypothetical protein
VSGLRLLVAGMVAGDPGYGGATWAVLQYVLGCRRLGHRVLLAEKVERRSAAQAAYFESVVSRFGLEGVIFEGDRVWHDFDAVLNLSGLLPPESIAAIPVRIYVDLDPAFNQMWHEQGIDRGLAGHTHFVTVGQAIGRPGCDVPTSGVDWIPTLPPVVLEEWPLVDEVSTDAFTTVANFRSYGSIELDSVHYGQKAHSLRGLSELPRRSAHRFVLAMCIHPEDEPDRQRLERGGWEFVDPSAVAATPDDYRCFVQGSRAEIGVAKSGYVRSHSGWFSDRSACYLASGRPVIAQDTGFAPYIPTGNGLCAFADEDGAVAAAEEVCARYAHHSRASRELAEDLFDSDRVLTTLLGRVGA